MPRFVTKITKDKANQKIADDICVSILSAGAGPRIRSYEPRSLLKMGSKHLIEHQISTLHECFNYPEIITVVGYKAEKLIKKLKGTCRIVENQIHESSNNSENIRLAFNNTVKKSFMFMHGDLYFNKETLEGADYSKSFIVVDSCGQLDDKEVGVTIVENKASILSYDLVTKWGQIAFVTGREYNILKNIFNKYSSSDKKMLSFEIINKIISMGGSFVCYESKKMSILEIDRIKDLEK